MTNGELDKILQAIEKDYKTEIVPITVSGQSLRCLKIVDLDEIILERLETTDLNEAELPYWGKIWEASILLAAYLIAQPVVPGRKILEIGTGLGVSGLFAASCGHDVTLSDHKEEIIRFIRANTLLNNLDNVPVISVDWTQPASNQLYDWIVGSEVVYHRSTYDSMVQFLQQSLKPSGTIFLAKSTSLPANVFFSKLTQYFKFKQLDKVMRSGDQEFAISLYAIKRKDEI
ncbi:MAG: protein N-lysine methyltransferase family protein [Deltaproteobacteria bacterium]|nr:protein N-lysine methyltransferase family protein [Deltaproteobacteria bacterium]